MKKPAKRKPRAFADYSSWEAFVSYGLACAAGFGDDATLLAMRRKSSYVPRKKARK